MTQTLNARLTRFALIVGVLLMASPLWAQTTIDNTTLSSNVTAAQGTVTVASVTCTSCTVNSNTVIFIEAEAMCVTGAYVSGTTLPVTRGCLGTKAAAHNTYNGVRNTTVFLGPTNRFHQGVGASGLVGSGDPPIGRCVRAEQAFMPWINVSSGAMWTCDGYNWRVVYNFWVMGQAPSIVTQ